MSSLSYLLGFDIIYHDENNCLYECAELESCLGLAARRHIHKNGVDIDPTYCKKHCNFGYREDE